jgi:enamine deaminase RidA (YjgF/YER057c/UK114 family)
VQTADYLLPLAIGHYVCIQRAIHVPSVKTDPKQSQAFVSNNTVYVAGQVAADLDGKLIKGSTTEQAEQICRNIDAILTAAGSCMEKVVKVVVRLSSFSGLILP